MKCFIELNNSIQLPS